MGRHVDTLVETDCGQIVSVHAVHALDRTLIELSDGGDDLWRALAVPDRGVTLQGGWWPPLMISVLGQLLHEGLVAELIARGSTPDLSVVR